MSLKGKYVWTQVGKSSQNDRVSECPYVKAKYKIISKRLSLRVPQLFNCSRRGHSLSGTLAKAPWLLKPISKKSSHMQVENFTKSPESPYVKTKYKIHLKTTESQSVPMLRQNIKSSQNDRVSECPYVKTKYKLIWKRLSVENSYRNLQYFVKVKCRSFDDGRTHERTTEFKKFC